MHPSPPRPRALLVDDDVHVRRALHRHLRRQGWEVSDAADGCAALDLFEARPYDLVLTDWEMPCLDGVDLLERIADSGVAPRRLVMMTANETASPPLRRLSARGITVLRKPIDPRCLDLVTARASDR